MAKNKSTLIIDGTNKGAIAAVDGTVRRLNQGIGQVRSAGSGMTGALSGFTGLLTNLPFMASAAAIGVVAGFGAMIKKTIDTGDSFDKMSQRVGVSVEFLSTMRYAASLADVEVETLGKGIQKLSKNLYDASQNLGLAKDSFKELNIDVKDASGNLKSTEEVIFDLADKFAGMEDGTLKTAYAINIFGKAGAELIPMLNEGSEGLERQREEARKLGLEISTNTAKQAAMFKDNLTILNYTFEGLANTASTALLPSLISISESFLVASSNASVSGKMFEVFGSVLKGVVTAVGAFASGIYVAGQILGTFMAVAMETITLDFKGAAKSWEMGMKDVTDFSLVAGDAFKALWGDASNYNDLLRKIQEETDLNAHQKEVEALAKQWETLNKTLANEIAQSTMPEIAYQVFLIDQKFTDYSNKFPGHIDLINQWRDAMIEAATKPPELPALPEVLPEDTDDSMIDYRERYKGWSDFNMEMRAESAATSEFFRQQNLIRESDLQSTFGSMADALDMFANMGKNTNKTMFAAFKVFAIAEAGVATYLAATKALASIPFPFNFAAAAAVTAAGIANIARIASMQPGSTASGGGASAPSIDRSTSSLNNDNRQTSYVINFYGGGYDGDKDRLARDIIDSLNKASDDGLLLNMG